MEAASAEFAVNPRTLSARLTQSGISPAKDGKFSTKEIARAIFGDLEIERTRLVRAEAIAQERDNRKTDEKLIDLDEFAKDYEPIYLAIVRVIKSSRLAEHEQIEILNSLHELHQDHAPGPS